MADTNKDIQKFAGDIPAIAALLNMRVSDVVRHTAFSIAGKIIATNPVDTGYSRANWRIHAEAPDLTMSVPPDYLKKRGGGFPGAGRKGWYPMRSPALADAEAGTHSAFVTNSVHYVRWLENGTSRTPPLNFIKNAAASVAQEMNDFIKKSKEANPPPHA